MGPGLLFVTSSGQELYFIHAIVLCPDQGPAVSTGWKGGRKKGKERREREEEGREERGRRREGRAGRKKRGKGDK